MVVSTTESSAQCDVIFVIEATTASGTYIDELKDTYIIPTLEYFHGGNLAGGGSGAAAFGVVFYKAADNLISWPVSTHGPYSNAHQVVNLIDKTQFQGGEDESHACVTEALTTAIACLNDMTRPEVTRHVVLLCCSKPYAAAAGGIGPIGSPSTVEQAASALAEFGVNVSVISARKHPSFLRLFEQCGGDLPAAYQRNYAEDPRHLVLLKGYSLKERAPSPAPPPPAVEQPVEVYKPRPALNQFQQNAPAYRQPQPWRMVPPRQNYGNNSALLTQLSQPSYPPPQPTQQTIPSRMPLMGQQNQQLNQQQLSQQLNQQQLNQQQLSQQQLNQQQLNQQQLNQQQLNQQQLSQQQLNQQQMNQQQLNQQQLNQQQMNQQQLSQQQLNQQQLNQQQLNQQQLNQQQLNQQQLNQPSQSQPGSSMGGGPTPQAPGSSTTMASAPQMQPQRTYIWQGILEWIEKGKTPGDQQKITKQLPCQVSANSKDVEPELKAETWPNKLFMQLMPKQLIGNIGGQYLKDSKSVLFHPQQCDALESLTKVMVNGFAGCVHFTPVSPTSAMPCDIKVLILLYTPDKKAYLGFIPNSQGTFVDRLKKVIQQQKLSQIMNKQLPGGPGVGNPGQVGNPSGAGAPGALGGVGGVAGGGPGPAQPMVQPPAQMQQHPQTMMMGGMGGGVGPVGGKGVVRPLDNLEVARQQNLDRIQQLQQTLEAAQQQEAQYKSQMEIVTHLQAAQQQEQHYKQLEEQRKQQQLQAQLQQQLRGPQPLQQRQMMRPMMNPSPGLRHLLQQQPQYRPGSGQARPPSQPQQFDELSNYSDFLQ